MACFVENFKGKDTCAIQSETPVGGIERIKIDDPHRNEKNYLIFKSI
jgi:hypothetical protein